MRAVYGIAAGLIALAACGGNDDPAADAAPAPIVLGAENITIAETAELSSGPVVSGTLTPELAASVRAEIAGSVIDVSADAGM